MYLNVKTHLAYVRSRNAR